MIFTSAQYLAFFLATVLLCYATPLKWRWLLLLISSAYFYWTTPTGYLLPVIICTVVTWYGALLIERCQHEYGKKVYLFIALFILIGNLAFFKFGPVLKELLGVIASYRQLSGEVSLRNSALPVGISFYTFLAVGYLVDIFRREYPPETNPGVISLYVLFFPKLVAGPIERGRNLLAQLHHGWLFDPNLIKSGLLLIAWGLFKKLVVADRAALVVDVVYASPTNYYGWAVVFASYLYSFQIYCDFSGYTDIAIGSARILGYDLLENFKRPYLATSIKEFWRRWHISLTSWLRDYLYVPLGGNRVPKWRWYVNIMTVFILSGIWHGAGFTFVAWGILHGLYYVATIWVGQISFPLRASGYLQKFDRAMNLFGMFVTFQLVTFAWVFFRADSVTSGWLLICNAIHLEGTLGGALKVVGLDRMMLLIFGIAAVMCVEWVQELEGSQWFKTSWVRWILYYLLAMSVLLLGVTGGGDEFIYGRF